MPEKFIKISTYHLLRKNRDDNCQTLTLMLHILHISFNFPAMQQITKYLNIYCEYQEQAASGESMDSNRKLKVPNLFIAENTIVQAHFQGDYN